MPKGVTPPEKVVLTQQQLVDLVTGRDDKEIAAFIRKCASRGRRPAAINLERVMMLAMTGCSHEEIAANIGMSDRGLRKRILKDPRIPEYIEIGRLNGAAMTRSKIHQLAMQGNTALLIWKDKTQLGAREFGDEGRQPGQQSMLGGVLSLDTFRQLARVSRGEIAAPGDTPAPPPGTGPIIDVKSNGHAPTNGHAPVLADDDEGD